MCRFKCWWIGKDSPWQSTETICWSNRQISDLDIATTFPTQVSKITELVKGHIFQHILSHQWVVRIWRLENCAVLKEVGRDVVSNDSERLTFRMYETNDLYWPWGNIWNRFAGPPLRVTNCPSISTQYPEITWSLLYRSANCCYLHETWTQLWCLPSIPRSELTGQNDEDVSQSVIGVLRPYSLLSVETLFPDNVLWRMHFI